MKRPNDERPDRLWGYPPLSAVDRHQLTVISGSPLGHPSPAESNQ